MKSRILNVLKAVLGFVILFGYLTPLYLVDRTLCIPLIWLKSEGFVSWLRNNEQIINSATRVGVSGLIGFVIWLIA